MRSLGLGLSVCFTALVALASPSVAKPVSLDCRLDNGKGIAIPWSISLNEEKGTVTFSHQYTSGTKAAVFTHDFVAWDYLKIDRTTLAFTRTVQTVTSRGTCKIAAPKKRAFLMLQIIGWLMCAYLVVKALELFGHAAHSERGKIIYNVGGVLSLICAPIFYFLMNAQVANSSMPSMGASSSSSNAWNNLEAVGEKASAEEDGLSLAEIERQADELEAEGNLSDAADNALEAAERALPE